MDPNFTRQKGFGTPPRISKINQKRIQPSLNFRSFENFTRLVQHLNFQHLDEQMSEARPFVAWWINHPNYRRPKQQPRESTKCDFGTPIWRTAWFHSSVLWMARGASFGHWFGHVDKKVVNYNRTVDALDAKISPWDWEDDLNGNFQDNVSHTLDCLCIYLDSDNMWSFQDRYVLLLSWIFTLWRDIRVVTPLNIQSLRRLSPLPFSRRSPRVQLQTHPFSKTDSIALCSTEIYNPAVVYNVDIAVSQREKAQECACSHIFISLVTSAMSRI
jgi:hypothetical protein